MKKLIKALLILLIFILFMLGIMTLVINLHIIKVTKNYIISEDRAVDNKYDCIVVLGASVKSDGTPSKMLEDRLEEGLILYFAKASNKLLMSGDHEKKNYDEVNTMKKYAIKNGVDSSDIFMDHAGLSTYDSMYRLKHIYNVNKVLIVSQEYHLYRAVYIARKLGIDAYAVPAEDKNYSGQFYRDIREIVARVKDYFKVKINPESTYTGDVIPVIGDGDVTNDK